MFEIERRIIIAGAAAMTSQSGRPISFPSDYSQKIVIALDVIRVSTLNARRSTFECVCV